MTDKSWDNLGIVLKIVFFWGGLAVGGIVVWANRNCGHEGIDGGTAGILFTCLFFMVLGFYIHEES